MARRYSSAMSGRFRKVYSDEQRGAVVRAIVDQGMPAATVVYTAEREGLEGLPAFPLKPSTARMWAMEERQRRDRAQLKTPHGAAAKAESLLPRCIALAEAEIARLEAKAAESEPVDLGLVRQAARLAVDIRRWARQVTGTDEPEAPKPEVGAGLLERLSSTQPKTERGNVDEGAATSQGSASVETQDHAGGASTHA